MCTFKLEVLLVAAGVRRVARQNSAIETLVHRTADIEPSLEPAQRASRFARKPVVPELSRRKFELKRAL